MSKSSIRVFEGALGRLHKSDERDRLFTAGELLKKSEPSTGVKSWRNGVVLNQGRIGSCVGHAWRGWMQAAPLRTTAGPPAIVIYDRAQEIDDIPETPPEEGTTVRAGAKVMVEYGRIAEYRWSWNSDEIVRWLLNRGPVVIGIPWYEGFDEPTKTGLVKASGRVRGGHALYLYGANTKQKIVRAQNSWGDAWANKGRCKFSIDDLELMISKDGEACMAIEKKAS